MKNCVRTDAELETIPKRRRKRRRKRKKRSEVRVKITWKCFIVIVVGAFIFIAGLGTCLTGFSATEIMHLDDPITKPGAHAQTALKSQGRYLQFRILYNLRFVGPGIMGVGGFLILCTCVVIYNEKDKLLHGERRLLVASLDDIYERAIQAFLDQEELNKVSVELPPLCSESQSVDSFLYRYLSSTQTNSEVTMVTPNTSNNNSEAIPEVRDCGNSEAMSISESPDDLAHTSLEIADMHIVMMEDDVSTSQEL